MIQVVGETGSMFCLDAPEDEVGMSDQSLVPEQVTIREPLPFEYDYTYLYMGLSKDRGQKKTLRQVSMEKMMINHEIWGHQIITRVNIFPPN